MTNNTLLKFETKELKSLLAAKYFIKNEQVEIVNRSKRFSFDDSFVFKNKNFDCGYHAVDIGRSKIYNDLLRSTDLEFHSSPSTRSLVFNNKKYDRGYDVALLEKDFSLKNKNRFNGKFLKNLERIYGSDFISFAIENISQSYAQNKLWIQDRLSDEIILTNIYPWFFPYTDDDKAGNLNSIRPHFHNKMIQDNLVMYPKHASFGSIAHALETNLKNFISSVANAEYEFASLDDNGKITVEDNTVHVLPIDYLDIATRFNLEYPHFNISNFYLVSVVLENEINFKDHEILVGDKNYYIDRVSSTDSLSGNKTVTAIQFECESLIELSEDILVDNLKAFSDRFLEDAKWSGYNIKKVPLKRYNTDGISEKCQNIVNFVELMNPQVIVLNRNFNFENLSESVEHLISRIQEII